jgi:predicted cytidylate kinase
MIICVCGLSGSGKTTISDMLAKKLGIGHVTGSYKQFAKEGKALQSFVKKVKPSFDKDFNKRIIKEANASDCVVSTWLAPWIIKNSTLNVWLETGFEERVKRKARDLKISLKEAKKHVIERDSIWPNHIKKELGIDIVNDHKVFDISLNTERLTKEQMVATISMLSLEKENKKFR